MLDNNHHGHSKRQSRTAFILIGVIFAAGVGFLAGYLTFDQSGTESSVPSPVPSKTPAPVSEGFVELEGIADVIFEFLYCLNEASASAERPVFVPDLKRGFGVSRNVKKEQAQEPPECNEIIRRVDDISTDGWNTTQLQLRSVVLNFVQQNKLSWKYPTWQYIPITSMNGPHRSLSFAGTNDVTVDNLDQHLADLNRIRGDAFWAKLSMIDGLALGYCIHSEIIEDVPSIMRSLVNIDGNNTEDSDPSEIPAIANALKVIDQNPIREELREQFLDIGYTMITYFRDLADYIEETYIPALKAKGNESFSVNDCVPSEMSDVYEKYYIPLSIGTNASPNELHELGLTEMERISLQMSEIATRHNFTNVTEYKNYLETSESNQFSSKDDMLLKYSAAVIKAYPKLGDAFENLPTQEHTVRSTIGGPNQTMAGYFPNEGAAELNANYYYLYRQSTLKALMFHESIPGHHLQFAYNNRRTKNHHPLIYTLSSTVFVEGWGLYSEYIGDRDLNGYSSDEELFGRLQFEQFRAARLVVDTGIHDRRWSLQQCIDTMVNSGALSVPEAQSECRRYVSIPGQALAYKWGEIAIIRLRTKAENELGERFDLKKFHSAVLENGFPTMEVLEMIIDDWIADEKAV